MNAKIIALIAMTLALPTQAIEKDKQLHFGVSTVIGGIAYYHTESAFKSMVGCTVVGVGKEVYDEISYGGFDEKDLLADVIGCGVGTFVSSEFVKFQATNEFFGVKFEGKF